jgi:hypothetical protein
MAQSFAPHIDIRQGENGAPSRPGSFGAISQYAWTEELQAKWATRRLLGDLGRDIPSSYFSICDMRYPDRVNFKGLLAINPDRTVHHKKLAYHTVQHITALFDDDVQRVKEFHGRISGAAESSHFAVFGYRGSAGGSLVTLWRSNDTPGEKPQIEWVQLATKGLAFECPVWIDLLTGRVYTMSDTLWSNVEQETVFSRLPVYDSAVVIGEKKEIERRVQLAKPAAK